jgi:crotonobetainyl-CoA:carnitine CoA-transferase CaiB-like acyl-CoA transferase
MQPLAGVRVLDLTRLLPGPFATLVLADLGAQVDKIEDAGQGDYTRQLGVPQVAGMSAGFHALNRGKRSAVVDLKNPGGRAVLARLARHYDVLFEQFRPGVLDRLGIGHSSLRAENPRLIVCALTGYGQDGPLRDRAGHDLNYMARAGLLGIQGPSDGPPQIPAFQLADVSGGLWCVVGILSALRERERTGQGTLLDISMLESVIPFATITLGRLFGGGGAPERGADTLTGGIAPYQTYRTSDGEFMSLGALEPKFFMRFCQAAGIEADSTLAVAGPHQVELKRRFAEVFASKTRTEWEVFGRLHDVCLEPVLRPDELLADPQLSARGAFFEFDTGEGVVHQYRTPVTPRDLEARPAPTQGQHTDQVLGDASFDAGEIAELRKSGAIR